jgi:hypothetical protein
MSEKNVQSFLREIKAELAAMTPDDVCPSDMFVCDEVCLLCEAHELPITEALTKVLFLGHDLALESTEFRFHFVQKHLCEQHRVAFVKCIRQDGRTSFGR